MEWKFKFVQQRKCKTIDAKIWCGCTVWWFSRSVFISYSRCFASQFAEKCFSMGNFFTQKQLQLSISKAFWILNRHFNHTLWRLLCHPTNCIAFNGKIKWCVRHKKTPTKHIERRRSWKRFPCEYAKTVNMSFYKVNRLTHTHT